MFNARYRHTYRRHRLPMTSIDRSHLAEATEDLRPLSGFPEGGARARRSRSLGYAVFERKQVFHERSFRDTQRATEEQDVTDEALEVRVVIVRPARALGGAYARAQGTASRMVFRE